jgi:hypothetical protein
MTVTAEYDGIAGGYMQGPTRADSSVEGCMT